MLSEVKLEVETVIKTGRQIVQKQQTENPKSMDEQLTALKLLYNELGAQVYVYKHTHTHTQTNCCLNLLYDELETNYYVLLTELGIKCVCVC